jgi:hypothetical protein
MKTTARTISVGTLALFALSETAAAQELSGSEIKRRITGERVYLSTPFGGELPLTYKASGQVIADVSGISAAGMFAPRGAGRWWVEGNRLCQKWPTWRKGRQYCFTIKRTGENRISWFRNDGKTGTARIGG